jgi:hypothetical protein
MFIYWRYRHRAGNIIAFEYKCRRLRNIFMLLTFKMKNILNKKKSTFHTMYQDIWARINVRKLNILNWASCKLELYAKQNRYYLVTSKGLYVYARFNSNMFSNKAKIEDMRERNRLIDLHVKCCPPDMICKTWACDMHALREKASVKLNSIY